MIKTIRIEEVKNILEDEYGLLDFNEYMVEEKKDDVYWLTAVIETQERIEEIEKDSSNYIQGGEGYISGYLSTMDG